MNQQVSKTMQLNQQKQAKQSLQKGLNPRKAATKLKDVNYNVQIMKKRFKVLQVQDDYNRYKTIDNEKRVNLHQDLHVKLLRDRQLLRKSLQKVHDLTQIKQKSEQIRQQIKQKLKQAKQNLYQQRSERTQSINEQFIENTNKIKQLKQRQLQQNRQKSMICKFNQEKKRQSISRHMENKYRSIQVNKSIDSAYLQNKAKKQEEQLDKLMKYQQELIKKSSQSLQASQVMKHRFNQVFTNNTLTNKSRLLPQIRSRTNNSTHTNTNSRQSQL